MPKSQAKKNRDMLETEIGTVTDALNGLSTTDPDYKSTLKKLKDLYALRENHTKRALEVRDVLPVLAPVAVALIVVSFEAFGHTAASKVVSLLPKSSLKK